MRPQAIRRLPLKDAIAALKTGEGSTPLPNAIKALHLSYTPQAPEMGTREFLRTIGPRIAYANPALPFVVERVPNPRDRRHPQYDPAASFAEPTMTVTLSGRPAQKITLTNMSADAIYKKLLASADKRANSS